jgi:hypothetical protein
VWRAVHSGPSPEHIGRVAQLESRQGMYAGFGDNDSDSEQHNLRLSGRTERALQRLMASEPPNFDTGMSWNQLGLSVTNCPGLRELVAPAEGPDPRESRSPLPAKTRPLSRQHEPFVHEGLDAFLKEKVDSFEAYKSDPIPGRPDQRYPTNSNVYRLRLQSDSWKIVS